MLTENIYIDGSDVTSSSDVNVLISLGGTPAGAALEPFSINASWSGQLSTARGGTGLSTIGSGLQLLRTNAGATGLEYFSASTSDIPEGSNQYFTESRTRSTVLTGLSVTGSAIVSSDTILQALGKAQNQINALVGGVNYQGTWNATTNSPAITSGVGTKGYYYVVDVAGSTNIDGITDWKLGDWIIFNGTAWQKVDNTDAVISVNGYTGIVSLAAADLTNGVTGSGSVVLKTSPTITTGITAGSSAGLSFISSGTSTCFLIGAGGGQNNTAYGGLKLDYGTASTVVYLDASKNLVSLANGTGVLTNNGAGVLSWSAASSGITVGTTTSTGTNGRLLFSLSGVVNESASVYIDQSGTDYNVKLGKQTGTIGNENVIIGYWASYNNAASLSSSVIIGYSAVGPGASVNSINNVFIGAEAGNNATNQAYTVAIGYRAGRGSTNFRGIYLGNNAGNGNTNQGIIIGYDPPNTTAAHQCIIGSNSADGYISDYYLNGVTHTAPYGVNIRPAGGSGTNINGADLNLYAGLPTGDGSSTASGRHGYMGFWTGDVGASGTTLRSATEKMRLVQGGDLVLGITSYTKSLVIKDSAGHYWRISVDTLGVLSTADLGTSIPT